MKTKGIIKEIAIFGLIVIAIFLIIAILLYGYTQTGKIVPNKVEYSTPENVKEEIMASDVDSSTPVKITYELDETQITNSKKSGSYTSGKQNPFAKAPTEETTEEEKNDNNNSNANTGSEGTNKNASSGNTSSSDGKNQTNETHYLPSTGTK